MTKRIEVPGVGVVEFPDSMSDEQITNAIRTNIMPKYSAKTETPLQTFGRSAASIPDTALNLITGTLDVAAYPLARAYYGMTGNRTPEQAAALAQQQTTSPKDVIGRALGVAGTPGYENAPQRQLGNYIGQTIGEGVVNPLAETTGMPAQDVGSMVNIGSMAVPGMVKGGYQAVKPVIAPVAEFGKGMAGVATGTTAKPGAQPQVWQQPSARITATEKYLPAQAQEQWRQGQISTPEAQQAMTNWTPEQQKLLARTKGNVPLEGQVARAAGEQFVEPLTTFKGWLPELGGAVAGGMIGGGPIGAGIGAGLALTGKALNAYRNARQIGAMNELGGMKFTAQTPAEAAALRGGQPHPVAGPVNPASIQPTPPAPAQQYPLTVQGPGQQLPPSVMPMTGAPRQVNIEGESYKLPYQIDVANSQSARPQQTPQQMALQKTQEIVNSKSTPTITQETRAKANDIAEQIRQRNLAQQQQSWQERAGVTLPNETSASMFESLPTTKPSQAPSALTRLKESINEKPPAQMTAMDEATARAEMAKQQAQITPEYRGTIVKEWVKGNQLVEGTPLDTSKKAYNGSNLTRSQVQKLMSIHIDSIPVIEGATPAQTINAMVTHLETNNPGIFKASKKKGPSNVSRMITSEESPSGINSISKEVIGEIYPNKEAYDKAMSFKILQEEVPTASYMEGDKLITMTPQNIPKDLMRSAGISSMSKTVRNVKTGKVIKD